MSKGLSNFQLDNFFKDEETEELKNNYMGTYSIDSITKYINFYKIIKLRNAKYPFAIFNTDKHASPGKHWWSFMDIHPKNSMFLFYSFGLEGFKIFFVNDKEEIINQLLYNFSKCKLKLNQKLSLCNMKFCVETWEKMQQKTKTQLTDTAQNLFHLLEQFAELKNSYCINILILENTVQSLTSPNCGSFQLYFYKNLFDPDERSKILNHKTLNKRTFQTIINQIFSTEVEENEYLIKNFNEKYDLYFYF